MSLKNKIISSLILVAFIQIGAVQAEESQSAGAQVEQIMSSTHLTMEQKAEQVAALIQAVSAEGGDVAALVAQILSLTPSDQMDLMVGTGVAAVAIADPAAAPQVIARVVAAVETPVAAKVVAAAGIAAPLLGLDTDALAAALESMELPSDKMDAIAAATADPASVLNIPVVTTAIANVIPTRQIPGGTIMPQLPGRISGYGDQTT